MHALHQGTAVKRLQEVTIEFLDSADAPKTVGQQHQHTEWLGHFIPPPRTQHPERLGCGVMRNIRCTFAAHPRNPRADVSVPSSIQSRTGVLNPVLGRATIDLGNILQHAARSCLLGGHPRQSPVQGVQAGTYPQTERALPSHGPCSTNRCLAVTGCACTSKIPARRPAHGAWHPPFEEG